MEFSIVLRGKELEAGCRAQELGDSCRGHRLQGAQAAGKETRVGAGST